jgi:serine/threonine-protein kinase
MSEPATVETELAPGESVGHYKLVSRIGEGGMGVVYEAEDQRLRRTVALKLLHPKVAEDPKRRRRFLREGKLAAQLAHPCIAAVYEVGEKDDRLFIAMELVRGRLLSALVSRDGRLGLAEALRIVREAARGLGKAHEIGVIHRDLKPDNLMIGEDGIVKILDFGVAKALEGSQVDFTDVRTHVGSLVGTPAYMSPEQAAGKDTDARSDIFSLGAVLYELLTGHKPFRGDTWQETIIAINRDTPARVTELRPELPAEVDRIVGRCMAKKPAGRYPSCRALVRDLDALLARPDLPKLGPSAVVTAVYSMPPTSREPRSHRRLVVIAALAALATLGAGLLLVLLTGESATEETVSPPIGGDAQAVQPPDSAEPAAPPEPVEPIEQSAPAPSAPASVAASQTAASAPTPSAKPVAPPPPPPRPKPRENPVLGF